MAFFMGWLGGIVLVTFYRKFGFVASVSILIIFPDDAQCAFSRIQAVFILVGMCRLFKRSVNISRQSYLT